MVKLNQLFIHTILIKLKYLTLANVKNILLKDCCPGTNLSKQKTFNEKFQYRLFLCLNYDDQGMENPLLI